MRRGTLLLAGALLVVTTATASAQATQAQKDECLLASKNCVAQVDDIYKRMQKLDKEIKKGTRVYTPEELKRLQQKLTETQELLRDLERPGR